LVAGVTGLLLWARIDDHWQRSFVTGPASRLAVRTTKDIRGACVQDTISEWPVAANVVPRWLSRSVIGTVGLVGRRVRAKRRLGALGRRVNHCHERTQIIRLGVWGLPAE
jgi:hypothetical protein